MSMKNKEIATTAASVALAALPETSVALAAILGAADGASLGKNSQGTFRRNTASGSFLFPFPSPSPMGLSLRPLSHTSPSHTFPSQQGVDIHPFPWYSISKGLELRVF